MKLLIFDCDGTLVDSELLCNLALEHQLSDLGVKCEADKLLTKYRGGKLSTILASIESEFTISLPDSFESEYRCRVNNLFDEHLQASDGVIDVLESLTVPFCIASSAPRSKIERALKVTGLAKFFDRNIFSSYEVGSWKPEPNLFLHAANVMNINPRDCYVVEDSLLGLQAANRAKMKSIYFAPGLIERNEFCTVQIGHMSELIANIT